MSETFPWTCPFCVKPTTITNNNYAVMDSNFHHSNKHDSRLTVRAVAIVCPNPECREVALDIDLFKCEHNALGGIVLNHPPLHSWPLLPKSHARPFPEYIPQQLRDDYTESCMIAALSPKASATLSRRCLQGIIRDFWGIKKNRLVDEINALEEKIDPLTWQAIDSVRSIGNIGAHMEKDVNLIIDVDSDEAQHLLHLIETLFSEWYIHRHEREQKMKKIIAIADGKKEEKKAKKQ